MWLRFRKLINRVSPLSGRKIFYYDYRPIAEHQVSNMNFDRSGWAYSRSPQRPLEISGLLLQMRERDVLSKYIEGTESEVFVYVNYARSLARSPNIHGGV